MAGRSIDFNINASDNGTIDKLVSKTKTANQEFEKLNLLHQILVHHQ